MSNYVWARNTTLELEKEWKTHKYHLFMHDATQAEFLESQIPFYFAVESFPSILLRLANLCESSEQRLLIIKNLWDEHGQGDPSLFHTHTFLNYLCSLSTDTDLNTPEKMLAYAYEHRNPMIQDWINFVLHKNTFTASEMASYLAGIEYTYAVISNDIANLLDSYHLLDKQQHYHNHSQWDWQHGEDLLVTADLCGKYSVTHFEMAQKDFLELFSDMRILTSKELSVMQKNSISFFFSREDSKVELNAFEELNVSYPSIFTVCSGGEHIISYLQQDKECNITAFDCNPNQLNVLSTKLYYILNKKFTELNEYLNIQGKFEQLFAHFRNFLRLDKNPQFSEEHILYACQQVFNEKTLTAVFGEDAVKYSKGQSFIEHFYNAISNGLFDINSMSDNIVYNEKLFDYTLPLNKNSQITYQWGNVKDYIFDRAYDIIDLSNVGDWMTTEEFISIIQNAKNALTDNGTLIVRKLLGNYNLADILKNHGFIVSSCFDDTLFYSEVYTCKKN